MRDIRRISKKISLIEKNPFTIEWLGKRKERLAPVIGICGYGGAGKSTLINAMVKHDVFMNKHVAVLVCDPPDKEGGSIQGDLYRMGDLPQNENIFLRSFSLDVPLLSVPSYIVEVISCLEEEGFDFVIVETQGIAQAHYDIYYISDVLIYVKDATIETDSLQMIKRGVHRIADLVFVNKGDIAGIDTETGDIMGSALNGKGIDELVQKILELVTHRDIVEERYRRRKEWLRIIFPHVCGKLLNDIVHKIDLEQAIYAPCSSIKKMMEALLKTA